MKTQTTCSKPETAMFEIISYDIWGNSKDGYEVNQAFHTGRFVELHEDMTDAEIIKALVLCGEYKAGSNHKRQMKHVDIDGEFEFSLYIEHKGRPENELRRVYD